MFLRQVPFSIICINASPDTWYAKFHRNSTWAISIEKYATKLDGTSHIHVQSRFIDDGFLLWTGTKDDLAVSAVLNTGEMVDINPSLSQETGLKTPMFRTSYKSILNNTLFLGNTCTLAVPTLELDAHLTLKKLE